MPWHRPRRVGYHRRRRQHGWGVACSAETLRKQLEEAAQTKRVLEEARTELSEKAKLVHIKDTELKELKLKVEMVEKTQAQQPQPRNGRARAEGIAPKPRAQGAIKERAAEADSLQAEVKRLIAKEKEAQRKFEVRTSVARPDTAVPAAACVPAARSAFDAWARAAAVGRRDSAVAVSGRSAAADSE